MTWQTALVAVILVQNRTPQYQYQDDGNKSSLPSHITYRSVRTQL